MTGKENKRGVESILFVGMVLSVIIGLFFPKTGELVLLDQFFTILFICMVGAYVICRILHLPEATDTKQKISRTLVMVGCVIAMIWFSSQLLVDVMRGTEQIRLQEVEISKQQGKYGFLSLHYYLMGKDSEGNTERFEISADDYQRYATRKEMTVVYYKYTDRVYKLY